MGKVKSAIITALLLAAVLVLSLFATISCDVPGSNGVDRYNSFISNIHMGSQLTGDAYMLLYPEGVISVADYNLVAEDSESPDKEEYESKYTPHGGFYVEKDKLEELKKSVKSDAVILNGRLGEKGYSSYSVSVEDEIVIKISVPTNFTYSAYKNYDSALRSEALTNISNTFGLLSISGDISLRNANEYESSKSLLSISEDFGSYFKGVSYMHRGGTHAVRLDLTDSGFDKLNTVLLTGSDSETAYIYVGETNINFTMTMGKVLEEKTLYFPLTNQSGASDTTLKSNATDFSVLLNSVVNGNVLVNSFNTDTAGSGSSIIPLTPAYGDYAAVYLLVALLLALAAAIAVPIIRYKKLGLVNALTAVIYALVIIVSMLLLEISLTVAGAFIIVLGLALISFTNIFVFESVRKETLTGRTIQASVKAGYKKTLAFVLDMHIILLLASLLLALVCVGEAASCGFIFFIAVIASYVLYWFTRFMWYVISSLARDKFKFCGFKREVLDDED